MNREKIPFNETISNCPLFKRVDSAVIPRKGSEKFTGSVRRITLCSATQRDVAIDVSFSGNNVVKLECANRDERCDPCLVARGSIFFRVKA